MPKENLTQEEKNAQVRLANAWNAWKKQGTGRTQVEIAERIGINQSSFGQYINGRNPINLSFLFKICSIMQVDPKDIYPELFDDLDLTVLKKVVPPDLKRLLDNASQLDYEQLKIVTELSESLAQQREK